MYESTFHRDDTVTIWDVYQQQWRRLSVADLYDADALMASLPQRERARVERAVFRRAEAERLEDSADRAEERRVARAQDALGRAVRS